MSRVRQFRAIPPSGALEEAYGIPESDEIAEAFPIDALPESLRAFVLEAARVYQVPVELPSACCLATLSAALGSRLRVRSVNGHTTPANLMVLVAAETGTGKSEIFRQCVQPFDRCQEETRKQWQEDQAPAAKAEIRVLTREIESLEKNASKGEERRALIAEISKKEARLRALERLVEPPVYCASDFTTPQLIRLLCRMDGQLFAASPDAKHFVDMVLGRYNNGGTDEEVYLKAFSLEPIDRHRVGDNVHQISEACISGLWLTQPDKLERLLSERQLSEGGLLPRLLLFRVPTKARRVGSDEVGIHDEARQGYQRLITTLFRRFRLDSAVTTIAAEPEAKKVLADFHNGIADRRENDLRDLTGFAARWGEYAWRLALTLHAARHGAEASEVSLCVKSAHDAIRLMRWFANQQLDALSQGRSVARSERFEKVLRLFTSAREVTARDLYRRRITPRHTPEAAVTLLEEMVKAGHLSREDRQTDRKNHIQRVYLPVNVTVE